MTTNLGPLTTIFTPPASCLSTITSAALAGFFVGHFSAGNDDCYPPSTQTNLFGTSYFYSPGICPNGYSAACTWPSSAFSSATTASLCCPSGYSCYPGGGANYEKVCYSGDQVKPLTNVWAAPTGQTWPVTQTSLSLTTFPAKVVLHDGIPVVWQKTDTAILKLLAQQVSSTAATASSTTSSSNLAGSVSSAAKFSQQTASKVAANSASRESEGSSTSLIAPSGSTTSSSSSTDEATGFSHAAMAGIAIGVVAVFVTSLLGLFMFMRRRVPGSQNQGRRNAIQEYQFPPARPQDPVSPTSGVQGFRGHVATMSEMSTNEKPGAYSPSGYSSTAVSPVSGHEVELPGHNTGKTYELA